MKNATAPAAPFTVQWDTKHDAGLHWRLEVGPEPPLTQSVELYWYQGWARAAYERGHGQYVPRRIYVNGYAYSAEAKIDLGPADCQDQALQQAESATPQKWHGEWLPYIRAHWGKSRQIDLKPLPDAELSFYLQESLLWYAECGRIHAHMGWTTIDAVDRLVRWYLTRFGGAETDAHRLLLGLPNLSTQKGQHLWELSQRLTPAIEEKLAKKQWSRLPKAFNDAFKAYVEDYCDDRQRAACLLPLYRRFGVPEPRLQLAELAQERQSFSAQIRHQLAPAEADTFEVLLANAGANHPLTEDHNYWLDRRSFLVLKPIFKEFGRRFHAEGIINNRRDIDFIRLDEMLLWGYGVHDPLRPKIEKRRQAHRRYRRLKPPPSLGTVTAATVPENRYHGPTAPLQAAASHLRGVGAAAGKIRGKARLAHTPVEALALRPGEILVCPKTDPHWTPLFGLAAGLVTDHGGSLCHGAVLAREYQLPAVVGTLQASTTIKTGQTLEMDGTTGLIRLL
jgi:phosphohistidine swiveling domain-containing protein